ncbi:putative beta-ketoacyl synthase [Ramicandelaber brevisporus]|nr:putative beta-ketoacyl synthase [Ramicandelaber brevisporus]
MSREVVRRVVVTGLGAVTPLGTGVQTSWRRLIAGECGIIKLPSSKDPAADFPSRVAAVVPDFDDSVRYKWLAKGDERRMAQFTQYAVVAAGEALQDAGLVEQLSSEPSLRERAGTCIGSGIGSIEDIQQTALAYANGGYRKIGPMFVPRILVNMAAGHVSMRFGLQGPNHSVSTACTTGAHALGDAMRFIKYGDADVMVAGSTEASINPLAIGGFCRARSLATAFNESPSNASRPFDKGRDGFVIGEGAGVVVLEEYERAKARGAKIYCELRGYGLSGDAYHMTAPPDDGNGAYRAMKRALETAGLKPEEVDYVNAHATSTNVGDVIENRAIGRLFGEPVQGQRTLAVSSTKGAVGHLLGAAGSLEAIYTIMALNQNVLPPTLNLESPGSADTQHEFVYNYVAGKAQRLSDNGGGSRVLRAALSNSFGFGGTNASLCFAQI